MRKIQKALQHEGEYDYNAPTAIPAPALVSDWSSIDRILRDSQSIIAPWEIRLQSLGGSQGTSANTQTGLACEQSLVRAITWGPIGSLKDFPSYIERKTIEAIRMNSRRIGSCYEIDVINGVATAVWTEAAAQLLGIPLKTSTTSSAFFDNESLQKNLEVLFRYIFSFSKLGAMQELIIRRDAVQANDQLRSVIKEACLAVKCSPSLPKTTSSPSQEDEKDHSDEKDRLDEEDHSDAAANEHGEKVLRQLFESGKTVEEVVSLVSLLAVQTVTPSIFAIGRIMDLLMSERYEPHWTKIQKLSRDPSPWNSRNLPLYVLEALRLVPPAAPCVRTSQTHPNIKDWRNAQDVKKGETFLLDFAIAGRDGERFPHPGAMKLDRPLEVYQYLPFVEGLHGPLVKDIAVAGSAEQLRVFGKLEGLRRVPGASGMLKKLREHGVVSYLNDAQDAWVPLPPSLRLRFDALP
ncbi:hypothetical protein OPT61_g2941 [Boeremia exigua]|uniref:Uncharacterized protein n=1 Tax=Boeremia exigua TaxID=749465 RepID=A0ACC2IJM5_9PLEO|nr:hypothetical protein OPT61_g2941 [Boeremia exigua]